MRRLILVLCLLLMPGLARANPYILNPSSLIAFGVVAFWALVLEAAIVALLLAFAGLSPLRIFGTFLVMNLVIFIFVFCPLQSRLSLPALESVVVIIDAVCIKMLSRWTTFQRESYRNLSWWASGLTSLIGNAASFFLGVIASGSPWEMHSASSEMAVPFFLLCFLCRNRHQSPARRV